MDNDSARHRAMLDKIAVALSGLCLLHCLALPFAVALLPFLGQFSGDHFHAELLWFVVPVSGIALLIGYRRHHHSEVLIAGAAGLIVLAVGGTYVHAVYGELADRLTTVAGSLILAVTHYRNFRLTRKDLQSIT